MAEAPDAVDARHELDHLARLVFVRHVSGQCHDAVIDPAADVVEDAVEGVSAMGVERSVKLASYYRVLCTTDGIRRDETKMLCL